MRKKLTLHELGETLIRSLSEGVYKPFAVLYPWGNPVDTYVKSVVPNGDDYDVTFHDFLNGNEAVPLSELMRDRNCRNLLYKSATRPSMELYLFRNGVRTTVLKSSSADELFTAFGMQAEKLKHDGYTAKYDEHMGRQPFILGFVRDGSDDVVWLRIRSAFVRFRAPSVWGFLRQFKHGLEYKYKSSVTRSEVEDAFNRMRLFCEEQEALGRTLKSSNGFFLRTYVDADGNEYRFDI